MRSLGAYRALDTTFELRTSRRLADMYRAAYADLRAPDTTQPDHVVTSKRRRGERLMDTTYRARKEINDLAALSVVETHTLLTAGAFEVDGVAVALLGQGGRGKSTLAAAASLLRRHGYLADDLLAVTPEGFARPFHRPIGLRPPEAARLGITVAAREPWFGYPVAMGGRAPLSSGAPLGLIALVERHEHSTSAEVLSPAMALTRLTSQALRLSGYERVMFHRLAALVRRVRTIELYHHDLDEALDLLEHHAAQAQLDQEALSQSPITQAQQ